MPPHLSNLTCSQTRSAHPAHFPADLLGEIFQHCREEAAFLSKQLYGYDSGSKEQDITMTVGLCMAVAHVCRSWRGAAFEDPRLWSALAIIFESENSLNIANREQVLFQLDRTKGTSPLRLIIGTRGQLVGSGVKAEYPIEPLPFNFLEGLAPRVTELALAYNRSGACCDEVFNPNHHFGALKRLWLKGARVSADVALNAGFLRSPSLQSIVWGVGTSPPILAAPWTTLTELAFNDAWGVGFHWKTVRKFLAEAAFIERVRIDVCECASEDHHVRNHPGGDGNEDGAAPDRLFTLPRLHHGRLQHAAIRFYGGGNPGVPSLLENTSLPRLRFLAVEASIQTSFDTARIAAWPADSGSHTGLTHWECLFDRLNILALPDILKSMPVLKVFRCIGSYCSDPLETADSTADPFYDPYINNRFLRGVATDVAFDAALSGTPLSRPNFYASTPCPQLQELHVTNAYFTLASIKAFVVARLFGGTRLCEGGSSCEPGSGKIFEETLRNGHNSNERLSGTDALHSLHKVTIEDLFSPPTDDVYALRRLFKHLKEKHGVSVVVQDPEVYPC
ncbi:hypothetical protein FA13DRAFT_1711313 [Coprinellus micaceus]|uniref:Uncharacterized protein n=1 Tax=Coprinellus micaceus TaxID=71717 RepID=A0A4Y7T744_COPMI|nr:hypothetical protein FA13DRAFT_1711313 [Coprinellus micaceus]